MERLERYSWPGNFRELQNVIERAGAEGDRGTIHGPRGAAQLLGINPSTLRGRMEKLGLLERKR